MVNYQVYRISDRVTLLRVNDDKVRYFEANWYIPEGITYNAYVIKTDEGPVLIDLWKGTYSSEFMEALYQVVDPSEVKLLVINHAEPDHTGSLPRLLEANKSVKIACFPVAQGILESKYAFKGTFIPLRDQQVLDFGDVSLQFVYTPWVHWPETMMTFYKNESILFSGDAFGGYSIPDRVFDPPPSNYEEEVRKYMVTVIGNYRENLIRVLDKLEALNVRPSVIAPAHGLLWREDPMAVVRLYREVARPTASSKKKIFVACASMYGSVEEAVESILGKIKDGDVKKFCFTDESRPNVEDALAEADQASLILMASPTYETGPHPYIEFLARLMASKLKDMGKPVVLLTSYAWGSNAGKKLEQILTEGGFKVVYQTQFRERLPPQETEKIASILRLVVVGQPS